MKLYLYVLDTMADWECAHILAEVHSRRFFRDKAQAVEIIQVGLTRDAIRTMGGLEITPALDVDALQMGPDDLLLLPGADTWLTQDHDKILGKAQESLARGFQVAAICGATLGLAKVGALNHRKHTSNDLGFLRMSCPAYTGADLYQELPACTDGNLITASGLASIEFSCEVFQKLHVFKEETIEAWKALYTHRTAESFHRLLSSLQ